VFLLLAAADLYDFDDEKAGPLDNPICSNNLCAFIRTAEEINACFYVVTLFPLLF